VFKKNPPAEIASGVALRQQSVLFGFLSFAFDGHNFVASFLRDVAQGGDREPDSFRYRAQALPGSFFAVGCGLPFACSAERRFCHFVSMVSA
jgi:hypothetical protein